jgi:hypothetical protein
MNIQGDDDIKRGFVSNRAGIMIQPRGLFSIVATFATPSLWGAHHKPEIVFKVLRE